ncbi:putative membrane protein [Alloactinosynnema sp. L-07]|uniref:SCO6880 family protein n=1 Tax=Alloactinosynnema sp. L-07 TaxID=1653480 RepID=UPI00065EF026|nr:SCO6880 family protein [Alloactinosynnema sp. L-07]CRK56997.1 putative membrane protein [Alloactinosynnema sp. L-07]
MRTAVLGGEVARRGLFGALPKPAYAALGVAVITAFILWLGVGGMTGAISGFVVLAATYVLVNPWSRHRSIAENGLWALRWRLRRRSGQTRFAAPGALAVAEREPGEIVEPLWELPVPLGRVEPLDLAGTDHEQFFILHHHNPGEPDYLSVMMEVQGQASGLRAERAYDTVSMRYGIMLAQLAKTGSYIRGLQQINRIVPHDPTPHRAFVTTRVSQRAGLEDVIASYEELVDSTASTAEQHRNYLVARLPLTGGFFDEARGYGDGAAGWAGLVREELARLADLAVRAELTRPRVLGEQRSCAVLRSLQDPRWPIDRHEGVRWSNCWQSYRAERDRLVVNDLWHTRTAFLPRSGIAPAQLGPRWLSPLLTKVNPSVVRTLSVRMEFVPDALARAKAVIDVAQDGASLLGADEKGKVGDGTEQVMLSASARRLRDLAPGSGHAGVNWSMAISVTAADPGELRRACMRVANEAAQSALTDLDWQDTQHDVAVLATYPLARGMAVA